MSYRHEDGVVQINNQSKEHGNLYESSQPIREKLDFETNEEENDNYSYYGNDNEINDIREIEEELKNNLVHNNSNFRNPTLEEPSPTKIDDHGIYHSNVLYDLPAQPPMLPRLNQMGVSRSNPVMGIASSTTATHINQDPRVLESTNNVTPKHFKYAISDQISMFSSQEKYNRQPNQLMNTSDIVEYNRDPSSHRPLTNNADTLEREMTPFSRDYDERTIRTDHRVPHFHSFNQDLPNTQRPVSNAEIHHIP